LDQKSIPTTSSPCRSPKVGSRNLAINSFIQCPERLTNGLLIGQRDYSESLCQQLANTRQIIRFESYDAIVSRELSGTRLESARRYDHTLQADDVVDRRLQNLDLFYRHSVVPILAFDCNTVPNPRLLELVVDIDLMLLPIRALSGAHPLQP